MSQSDAHQKLVDEILLALSARGDTRAFKNVTGSAVTLYGARISFGLKGSGDIWAIVKPLGKLVWIEVKTGTGVQSKEQKLFGNMIENFGGVYRVCRSLSDAHASIEDAKRT